MTILVATDGSDAAKAAAAAACDLARSTGDEVVFVTVWRELRGDFGLPLQRLIPDLVEVEREHADAILAEARRDGEARGVRAETVSRHGDAAREIAALARESSPRMIVIGSHGQGKLESVLLGSVAHEVVHTASCPVLLVPAAGHRSSTA